MKSHHEGKRKATFLTASFCSSACMLLFICSTVSVLQSKSHLCSLVGRFLFIGQALVCPIPPYINPVRLYFFLFCVSLSVWLFWTVVLYCTFYFVERPCLPVWFCSNIPFLVDYFLFFLYFNVLFVCFCVNVLALFFLLLFYFYSFSLHPYLFVFFSLSVPVLFFCFIFFFASVLFLI